MYAASPIAILGIKKPQTNLNIVFTMLKATV